MTIPFQYPASPHQRLHGPAGYADYASFRPWLRDEFAFRCVFCLRREVWGQVLAEFEIDHFQPVAIRPDRVADYDNLLYVCAPCNLRKRDQFVADPLIDLLSETVDVQFDGTIKPQSRQAKRIVSVLQLDSPEMNAFRSLWISVIQLAGKYDAELYRRLLAYPSDLPDLTLLRPSEGNTRPDGIENSHFRRRERGELPELDLL